MDVKTPEALSFVFLYEPSITLNFMEGILDFLRLFYFHII